MIIPYILWLPLVILAVRVFQLSLWIQLVLIFLPVLSAVVLIYLETEKEEQLNRYTTFLCNLYPLQMFIYNLLRLEEFSRENVFLAFTLLTLSFWLILHGWIHPGINLTCALSCCIYFVGISYCRLRWNLLNDTYLNLYKGRDSFEWQDVILGMQTRVGKVNNRLNNSLPFQRIPKRQASKAAEEKILENPEVHRAVILIALAAATVIGLVVVSALAAAPAVGAEFVVGADNARYMLSSEEAKALMAAKRELEQANVTAKKALARNELFQNPISDAGREVQAIYEKEVYLAVINRTHAEQLLKQAQQDYKESLNNVSTSLSYMEDLMDHVSLF